MTNIHHQVRAETFFMFTLYVVYSEIFSLCKNSHRILIEHTFTKGT